jgi:hypothetical protein
MQRTIRTYHIVICGLFGCTTFCTISHKRHDIRKTSLTIKHGSWFSIQFLPEIFLMLRGIERVMTKNLCSSSCKVPCVLDRYQWNLNFSLFFRNVLKYEVSWKSVQWKPSCPMRTDGWTDGETDKTKLIVAFHNFTNALCKIWLTNNYFSPYCSLRGFPTVQSW